jgi:hypothetical protein
MRHFIVIALPVAIAAGLVYSAIKLWGDVAEGRRALAVLGMLSLLGSLGQLVILGLMLASEPY